MLSLEFSGCLLLLSVLCLLKDAKGFLDSAGSCLAWSVWAAACCEWQWNQLRIMHNYATRRCSLRWMAVMARLMLRMWKSASTATLLVKHYQASALTESNSHRIHNATWFNAKVSSGLCTKSTPTVQQPCTQSANSQRFLEYYVIGSPLQMFHLSLPSRAPGRGVAVSWNIVKQLQQNARLLDSPKIYRET